MTKPKPTKYEDDIRRNLRKSAEINAPQSTHDGIHTCSKGCKKSGCNRGLHDTIEEQNAQIEALKQDLLEQTAAVRNSRMANIHDLNYVGGLQEENARLKAEVESLKKPAVIGGYNISEYIRMANSETLEFDNGDIFADMTLPERIKYIVESHARLKAEVEAQAKRWAESEDLILHYKQQRDEAYNDCECHRLKAEVERLTEIIRREVDGGVDLREEAQRTVEENHKLRAEVERLRNLGIKLDGYVDLVRHENERLRKAGDAMAGALSPFRVKPFPGPYLCDLQKGWNAAKEGKSV